MRYRLLIGMGLSVAAVAAVMGLDRVTTERPSQLQRVDAMTPLTAQPVWSNGRWSIWKRGERMGDVGNHERTTYKTSYYRQRIGGEQAERFHVSYRHPARDVLGVLADGTVVLGQSRNNDSGLVLIGHAGHTTRLEIEATALDDPRVQVVGVIDPGVIGATQGRTGPDNKRQLLLFPFRDGVPDLERAVDMTDGRGFGRYPARSIGFHWPEVVWVTEHGLFAFDVTTYESRQIEVEGVPSQRYDEVQAFDGRFVVLQKDIIDIDAGRVVARRSRNIPIAMRDGVMYDMVVEHHNDRGFTVGIDAYDLTSDQPETAQRLGEVPRYNMYWGYGQQRAVMRGTGDQTVLVTDAGLRLFDGEQWITLPYLDPAQSAEP